MAQRKESEPLQKVVIRLFERDVGRMQEMYPSIGYNKAIRALVRVHVTKADRSEALAVEGLVDEIDMGEDNGL